MTEIQDRLSGLYGNGDLNRKPFEPSSWIHKKTSEEKKMERLTDKIREDLANQETLSLARNDIFLQAEKYIEETFSSSVVEQKIENFALSWDKLYEKHGDDLIIALGELTDEVDFINHEGFIDKDRVKEKIKEIRRRRQKLNGL